MIFIYIALIGLSVAVAFLSYFQVTMRRALLDLLQNMTEIQQQRVKELTTMAVIVETFEKDIAELKRNVTSIVKIINTQNNTIQIIQDILSGEDEDPNQVFSPPLKTPSGSNKSN